MINHVRTLLLNKTTDNYLPGTLGEEYVPPGYAEIELPTELVTARKIIFGSNPDSEFVNFRLCELLNLIHNTELNAFVYQLDPRVTYWPRVETDFYQAQKNINTVKTGGPLDAILYANGLPSADTRTGILSGEYVVRLVTRSGELRIVIDQIGRKNFVDQSIDLPGPTLGLSPAVQLPGSDINIQIADYVNPTGYMLLESTSLPDYYLLQENAEKIELEADTAPEILAVKQRMSLMATDTILASWNLRTYARPESVVTGCLPRLELLGEPAFLRLFGVDDVAEPYNTFKNIWFDAKDPSYRLAAFTLAMAYRTEELNRGN